MRKVTFIYPPFNVSPFSMPPGLFASLKNEACQWPSRHLKSDAIRLDSWLITGAIAGFINGVFISGMGNTWLDAMSMVKNDFLIVNLLLNTNLICHPYDSP